MSLAESSGTAGHPSTRTYTWENDEPTASYLVMFHAAPAGLNLYWLSSNLCSIVQQSVTLRIIRGHEERTSRKERRRA